MVVESRKQERSRNAIVCEISVVRVSGFRTEDAEEAEKATFENIQRMTAGTERPRRRMLGMS